MTPEELKHEATREDRAVNVRFQVDELEKVYAMVIPLKPAKDYEFGVNGVSPPPQTGYYYTCKHHNAETGNCDNYENRPRMCSSYPFYGNPGARCQYQDCTWEDGRNPTIPVDNRALTRMLPRQYVASLESCTKVAA